MPHQMTALRRRSWLIPATVLLVLAFGAILAPWIAPHNIRRLETLRLADSGLPPAWLAAPPAGELAPHTPFWLGTDAQGRDVLSAILFGLRVSLLVGVVGTLLALTAGTLLGLAAGYWRGWVDGAIMRLADVQLAFPSILIALFLMAVWGQGLLKIILAVAIAHWVIYARVVRGAVLVEREKNYVTAIRALGAGAPRIVLRHILPNLAAPILVISAVEFASVVMLEATLSFLGLGVPITRPSLGMLINFGFQDVFGGTWWTWVFPGLALVLLVLCLNWLADILRVRLMPEGEA